MGINLDFFKTEVGKFLELDDKKIANFEIYAEMLKVWNEKMNLTAITDREEVFEKHFFDCLLLFKYINIEPDASIIDVGTGAGFPGYVLKLAREDLKVTLLDSLNKRLIFLNELAQNTGVSCELLHSRAEDAGNGELRETFDYSVSRAVAKLPALCEYCLPLVKENGYFISLKGPGGTAEANEAQNAIELLGGRLEKVVSYNLPSGDERSLIIIKKISQTPSKYPRKGVKITKKPL